MFHDLKSLLGGALKRNHIEKEVTTAQILDTLNAVIAGALPPGRTNDARAVSIFDRVAMVTCVNAAASQLITQRSRELCDLVKQRVPRADLRGIRTRIAASLPGEM